MSKSAIDRVHAKVDFKFHDRVETTEGDMSSGYFEALFKAIDMVFRKNADYSTDVDPLANFRESEGFGLSVSLAIMVRLSDKWSRLKNYFRKGELAVKSESVNDTIVDMINYLAILYAALNEKDRNQSESSEYQTSKDTASSTSYDIA